MTKAEIYEGLTAIFHEAFSDPDLMLRPEMTAADVEGWDSVKMVTIIIATESRFGIHLRSREVDGLSTVGDLAAAVGAKLG